MAAKSKLVVHNRLAPDTYNVSYNGKQFHVSTACVIVAAANCHCLNNDLTPWKHERRRDLSSHNGRPC